MLSKQNCQNILFLTLYSGAILGYDASDIDIVAYKPRGVSVNIPHEESIKSLKFYASQDTSSNKSKVIKFYLTDFRKYEMRLVAVSENVELNNGDLSYTLTKIGQNTSTHAGSTKIDLVQYPIAITAFDPQGFRITLLNGIGVEGFVFWANVNEPLVTTKRAILRLSAFEPTDKGWISENLDVSLLPNDIVYVTIHIRRNGKLEKFRYLPPLQILELVPYTISGIKEDVVTNASPEGNEKSGGLQDLDTQTSFNSMMDVRMQTSNNLPSAASEGTAPLIFSD